MQDEVLAVVRASAPRRWFGIGVMAVLGGLLIYLALSTPPSLGWQVFLIVFGVAALWLAETTRKATEHEVQLTSKGLRSSSGEEIASVDQIARVERGTFAMKPSNGFLLRLKEPRSRRWQPGLWWAMGRRVGIGGVTPGSQSKVMAQMLEALLAERD
ncbi:hypothetical protein [Shimia aestuarii]|uniref:PH domain-containing protein n=1 Tax=Shimia aestuarii TaxID=254406 RepID=A0A1I4LZY0_9RHOB|nr:hypothetical protein [Shimia aestuarii]SFL96510.1 hypothetical protein SAMN04488042_102313 [Shimia aestuarii]